MAVEVKDLKVKAFDIGKKMLTLQNQHTALNKELLEINQQIEKLEKGGK